MQESKGFNSWHFKFIMFAVPPGSQGEGPAAGEEEEGCLLPGSVGREENYSQVRGELGITIRFLNHSKCSKWFVLYIRLNICDA